MTHGLAPSQAGVGDTPSPQGKFPLQRWLDTPGARELWLRLWRAAACHKGWGSDLPFSWWLWNSTRRLPVTETKCTCELMLLNIWKELARRKRALLGTIWNPHQLPSRHTSFEVKGQFCSFYSVGAQCTLPNLHGALSIKHDTIRTSRHNGSKVHRQRTTGTEAQHASLRGVEVLSS